MDTIRIAVDAMGGDFGPRLCVPASQKFLSRQPNVNLTLVGDENEIGRYIDSSLPQIEVVHTDVQVEMADKPSTALRHKTGSSLAIAIDLVAQARTQACVSAGNTGAMMAFARRTLGQMTGLDRPAICKALPTQRGRCWVLDLGVNTECSAEQLLQFAQMGTVLAQHNGVASPRVGLLNIGVESNKGRALEQQAAVLLQKELGQSYIGFVEANDVFKRNIDVVVCDGFSGNVLLKASEGVAELLQQSLKQVLSRSFLSRIVARLADPFIGVWHSEYNLSRYNGAILLGLSQPVIKSHGSASEEGFVAAIGVAYDLILHKTLTGIAKQFSQKH